MRVSFVFGLFILVAACAGAGDSGHPDAEDCELLRDHVADLRLAAADPMGRLNADDRAQHRAALRAASDARGGDCQTRSVSEVTCQLNATDLDSLRACAPTTDPEN
jgi:hypothetical protein